MESSPLQNVVEQEDDDLDVPEVLQDLRSFLDRTQPTSLFDKTATAVPVAAIKALLCVVQRSKSETMMGLQDDLTTAADCMLQNYHKIIPKNKTSSHIIALQSGIELFLKYVTRSYLEVASFEECRLSVLERGERFQMISLTARDRIAVSASEFVLPNTTILTIGFSRVVAAILSQAARTKHFDLIILEGRPDAAGAKAAQFYATESNIPVTVVADACMGYIMEKVDMVLTGADAVVENGGVVNKLGTYPLAACASVTGTPFYVAAESYKFARLYPLAQSDLPNKHPKPLRFVDTISETPLETDESIQVVNPPVDFTPSKFITLLFTDLGVLTPSAVSDELIRLYQ